MAHLLGFLGFCLQGGAFLLMGLWVFGVVTWHGLIVWPLFLAMGFAGMLVLGAAKQAGERKP